MTVKCLINHLEQEDLILEVWHNKTIRLSVLDRFKFNWSRPPNNHAIEVFNWHGIQIACLLVGKSANLSDALNVIKIFRKQQGFYYEFK